ncbi:MAG: hypothetical protein GF368_04895 [Candidatus Aenigmarchaeota archaeon]|nr:hypothetical protein [Candidatus Aenigmarchaeota archaeon]
MARKKSKDKKMESGICVGLGVFCFLGFLGTFIFQADLGQSLLVSFILSLAIGIVFSRKT